MDACCHHTRQAFSATIGCPALQPNAFWNSGMFETTPLTRNLPGECGSIAARMRARLFAVVRAPDLAPAEEEALLGREAVDLLSRSAAVDHVEQRHQGDAQAAVVGGVLAERQLAVQLHVVDRG